VANSNDFVAFRVKREFNHHASSKRGPFKNQPL